MRKKSNAFTKFAESINFSIPKGWEDVTIKKIIYDKVNHSLTFDLHFALVPQCKDFFEFLLKTEQSTTYTNSPNFQTIKIHFFIEFIHSSAQNIKDYLTLIQKRFYDQSKLDWNNLDVTFEDGQVKVKSHLKSVIDEVEKVKSVLIAKMQYYGFKDFNIIAEFDYIKEQKITLEREEIERVQSAQKEFDAEQPVYKKGDYYKNKPTGYLSLKIKDIYNPEVDKKVAISGKIFAIQSFVTKHKVTIFTFSIFDDTEAIKIRAFAREQQQLDFYLTFKENDDVEVLGEKNLDIKSGDYFIIARQMTKIAKNELHLRVDDELEKRIEFNAKTNMNAMDGIASATDYLAFASQLGHKAIAFTDLDSVQSFPEVYLNAKKYGVKPIYGATFTTISKHNNIIINPKNLDSQIDQMEFIVFDLETTGLSPIFDDIIQFGYVHVKNNQVIGRDSFFIKTSKIISKKITDLTKITNDMLKDGISEKEAIIKISQLFKNKVVLAHNAIFDIGFIDEKIIKYNLEPLDIMVIDTLPAARYFLKDQKSYALKSFAKSMDIHYDETVSHRADYDAEVLALTWIEFVKKVIIPHNVHTIKDLNEFSSFNGLSKQFTKEITVLARNQQGLKELFKLVSTASVETFYNGPKLLFEDIKRSPNILIGSSTLNSELINLLTTGTTAKIIEEIVKYDYIEIPAFHDFAHLINREEISNIDLKIALKFLVTKAKELNKLVIAVGDCRYIDPIDQKIHAIYINTKGIGGARHSLYKYNEQNPVYPLQYYLTTKEMKQQFTFLSDVDLINEIVVQNTHKLNQMIDDNIEVIKPNLYTPKYQDSAKNLKNLVYQNARAIYGDNLPSIVEERIEKELSPILNYGYDVIYWISHVLVKKSLDDGYIVGSRGSVGSSFVATLARITEVNPLPAHYICPNCKYNEFFDSAQYTSGYDLPDKNCPKCNTFLDKEGQSIPFETFLGFKADKVPDIDLNFSGVYQPIIHGEVRKIFGKDKTFRSGTVSKVRDKTAFGYVVNYVEENSLNFSKTYIEYMVTKVEGVKRTTGQHPGGIIVIPDEFDIEDFTPVAFPANDYQSSWLTTHFDYLSLHDNLLKFDLLGHDDPTAIKMLEELTQVKTHQIPKSDPKIISLFSSTEALGITADDILGETTGAMGIPEFGTSFVRSMLKSTKVTSFADLISISGLSHGKNVWADNADGLMEKYKLSFKDIVCCRDDIMLFLISKGLDHFDAFNIMETVRKDDKFLSNEQEQLLIDHNIPSWYIESIKKITYLFPKAHATAYVTMAWRIAYYKIYHPLAYYATYFSTRSEVFDIDTMIKGYDEIKKKLIYLNSNKNARGEKALSQKEKDLIPILEIALEMHARGFKFSNIDLNRSQATDWTIDHEQKMIIPPFVSVDGLGGTVAQSIIDSREQNPFLSLEDFSKRTSVNNTLMKKMQELKIFEKLPKTNQISMF